MATKEPKILSFDEIVAASDVEERIVHVPAWGGAVRVRGVTRKEHRKLVQMSTDRKGDTDSDKLEMWLLVTAMIEPKITQMEYPRLMEKNSGAVQAVLDAIMELSGLKKEALADAEADFPEEA